MRRFRPRLAAAALGLGCACAAGLALADPVQVPAGVRIPAVLTQMLDSGTAHVGDVFTFKTAKDEKAGDIDVPAGTPGTGRLAVVRPAAGKTPGSLALQADAIDLPDGRTISVNIDSSQPLKGHLSKTHVIPVIVPVPGGIFPGAIRSQSGDMILDSGAAFTVLTVAPREVPAPLLTAPPTVPPTTPPSAAPGASNAVPPPPVPGGSPQPAAS
jgi:hypothetical protein